MENLVIEATKSTPIVNLDANSNILKMEGESYPENVTAFYNPIFEWIENYINQLNASATIDLKLSYLNTSSSKAFMKLLDMFEEASQQGKNITINWHYDAENEMAKECGEEFKEDLELPFNLVEDN